MPTVPVEAPTLANKAARLLDAGRDRSSSVVNGGWTAGLAFRSRGCRVSDSRNPCDDPVAEFPDPDDFECETVLTWLPYEIMGAEVHSTFGLDEAEEIQRATEQLDICRSARLEANLWADEAGMGNPSFDSAAVSAVATDLGSFGLTDGLRSVIAHASTCGCGSRKVIHASPRVVAGWFDTAAPLLRREGPNILTNEDHLVVSGAGYPGTGPDGDAPPAGSEYVWITEQVDYYLSPVTILGGQRPSGRLDVTSNVGFWVASQYGAAVVDTCCIAYAEINYTSDDCVS